MFNKYAQIFITIKFFYNPSQICIKENDIFSVFLLTFNNNKFYEYMKINKKIAYFSNIIPTLCF